MNIEDAHKINQDYTKLESNLLRAIEDGNSRHIDVYIYDPDPVDLTNLIIKHAKTSPPPLIHKDFYVRYQCAQRLLAMKKRLEHRTRADLYTDPPNAFELIGVFHDIILEVRGWIVQNDPNFKYWPIDKLVEYTKERIS